MAVRFLAWGTLAAMAVCAIFGSRAIAAPTIERMSLRGLQIGGTTTIVIDGADLLPAPQVVLPFAVARQGIKSDATANRVELEIALDDTVAPGIYQLRVANAKGISNAVPLGVDRLPQRIVPPLPAVPVVETPVALHGAIEGGKIQRVSFEGKAGQAIVVDVEARRLGGALNPVLHLFDPNNAQLAWAQTAVAIGGDARLVAKLPADGRYTVELHDALYRGDNPGYYRLKIGELHFADVVFPLGAPREAKTPFEFVGANLPEATRVEVDLSRAAGKVPVAWPTASLLTGGRPAILVDELPLVLEAAPGMPQEVPSTAAVNGRLSAPTEEDRYVVPVSPGQALRIDVLAARAGSPLDGVLAVRNDAGAELATSDDRPRTTDPGLDFKVPEGVNKITIAVKDLLGRGGRDYVYRLAIAPADRPDFTLELPETRHQVPRSGAELIRVRANRSGYNGPIKLAVEGVPAGVRIVGDEIPAGVSQVLVSLVASDSDPVQGLATIVGTATEPNVNLVRAASGRGSPAESHQPWLRCEIAVAVTEPSALSLAWEESSAGAALPRGATLPMKLKIARAAGAIGPVRLSLVTNQDVPKKEVKENNETKQVDDLEKALRLDGAPTIAADQSEVTASLLVPGDLPELPYDVAVKAELMAPDGKSVLASAVTPARRLTAAKPFAVELASVATIDAKAGTGDTGKLLGRVARLPGYTHPVTVTLAGLPKDLPAPQVVVPGDQREFTLPVAFPFGVEPAELKSLLVGRSAPTPGTTIESAALPVTLRVVAGGPPPALYRVFDDEPHVVRALAEGGGKAMLEETDRFAGPAALRVTGDRKFRDKLVGLGVRIAEKPGEGEYRYVRFAWKKRGGANVMIELNAGGKWGPKREEAGPALRYEAGQPNALGLAAVRVDETLPEDWVVVTRDLYADFGAFQLDGLGFVAGDGEYALFDYVYLARSEEELKGCPEPIPPEPPLAVFEDQADFVANLNQGGGTATLITDDKFTGAASARVTPDQRANPALPGLGVKIRQNPGPGEYRYLQFAWKKQGGERICLQLNHDGQWGPSDGKPAKFRYDAGPGEESFGAALRVDATLPGGWVLVTRDLYADFGEFTLSGLGLSPIDGEYGQFDHIYLGRSKRSFERVKP